MIVRTAQLLRFKDTNEAFDPLTVASQIVIPTPRELGRMQILLVGQREEKAIVASPVFDERRDIEPQVESHPCFRSGWNAKAVQSIVVSVCAPDTLVGSIGDI